MISYDVLKFSATFRNESEIHKSLHKEEEFETVEVNTNEKDVGKYLTEINNNKW